MNGQFFTIQAPIPDGQNFVQLEVDLPFVPVGAEAFTSNDGSGAVLWSWVDPASLGIGGAFFNLSGAPQDDNQVLTATFRSVPGKKKPASPFFFPVTSLIPVGQNTLPIGMALPFTPVDAIATTANASGAMIWASADRSTLSDAGGTFDLSGAPIDANQLLTGFFIAPLPAGGLLWPSPPAPRHHHEHNPLRELHEQGLEDLEESLGRPVFTAFGVCLPCSISTLSRGTTIEFGGRLVDIKFSLIVRTAMAHRLPKPLEAGKTITYEGVEYRIVQARKPAPGAHVHIDVIDPNR